MSEFVKKAALHLANKELAFECLLHPIQKHFAVMWVRERFEACLEKLLF
jgi:hypothetical protein